MTKTKIDETTDAGVVNPESCIFVIYSGAGIVEQHGVLTVSEVLDSDILDTFPTDEDPDLKENIGKSALAARLVENTYGIRSVIATMYGDRHDTTLSSIFAADPNMGDLVIQPFEAIHMLMLYCINGVDALNCLQNLGGADEVDTYIHCVSELPSIKMCKKAQRLFQFTRIRKDDRMDITRAVFIVEPSKQLKGAYDCIASYDLARGRFVLIEDGTTTVKATKEAKRYAKDYAGSTVVEHGDEAAGPGTGEDQ